MKKRFNTVWLSIAIWTFIASIVCISPNLSSFIVDIINSNSDKLQYKGLSPFFSVFLVVLPSYLLVLAITIFMRHRDEWLSIREYWKKEKKSKIDLGNWNKVKPSEEQSDTSSADCGQFAHQTILKFRGEENKSEWNFLTKIYHTVVVRYSLYIVIFLVAKIIGLLFGAWDVLKKIKNFLGSRIMKISSLGLIGIIAFTLTLNAQNSESVILDDGTEIYPEFYEIKDQEVHVTLITVVGEKERDSRLLVGVFEGFFNEEHPMPLFEEIISFEGLEEKFGDFGERGAFMMKIRENLNLYLLVKDKAFIILGEFIDEEGSFEGYFRICYPVKNLLFNRMDLNEEPIPSKVYSENCKIIKIKKNPLDYKY